MTPEVKNIGKKIFHLLTIREESALSKLDTKTETETGMARQGKDLGEKHQ